MILYALEFIFTSSVCFFGVFCLEESLVEVAGGEAEYVETLVLLLAPLAPSRRECRLDGRPQPGVLVT